MEIEEPPKNCFWSSRKCSALQLCMQAVQVCVGLTITLIGLGVGGVGLWAMLSQQEIIIISDGDPELTKLSLSLIVAGGIVALLGAIGVIGGLFMRSIVGRILIGVYAFVLVLLIINEVGAGVSAFVFQDDIKNVFVKSAKRSLMKYGKPNSTQITEQWDKFQQKCKCCGAVNYTSYRQVFNNYTVPASCCRKPDDKEACDRARTNATAGENDLYTKGCPDAVLGQLEYHDQTAAILAIVFAAIQFTGVVLACAMAYMSSWAEGKKSRYSYNRLSQEQT